MKENATTTNFAPNEFAIFAQTTKIGTNENKAIHSVYQNFTKLTQNFLTIDCVCD